MRGDSRYQFLYLHSYVKIKPPKNLAMTQPHLKAAQVIGSAGWMELPVRKRTPAGLWLLAVQLKYRAKEECEHVDELLRVFIVPRVGWVM